jgi:hypothetical protein
VEALVAKAVPPVEAAYQSMVEFASGGIALTVIEPAPHRDAAVPAVGAVGKLFTMALTSLRGLETQVVPKRDSTQ